MSSSEQDQESVGATASSSEHDEQPDRSCSTSPVSDAASVTPRSSVERDCSNSSRQSTDSTIYERYGLSGSETINNLLVKVEKDFREICLNEDIFKKAVQSYLDRVVDFVTLGVAFSVYREVKMGAYTAAVVRMEQPDDKVKLRTTDIFAEYYDKERKCICSKCTKMILASGFAGHLEVCMGITGRIRNTRRNVAATSSREQDSPTFGDSPPSSDCDNDSDTDWSSTGEKRKKKRDRNATKRTKGTPTKKTEIDTNDLMELEEVDIEGGTDEVIYDEEEEAENDLFNLSEFFVDDSSQSYTSENSPQFRSNSSSDTETKQEQSSSSPTSSS